MASAHGRHRESLERIIAFSSSPPLEAELRTQADKNFYQIVEHYENSVTTPQRRLRLLGPDPGSGYTMCREYLITWHASSGVLDTVLGLAAVRQCTEPVEPG